MKKLFLIIIAAFVFSSASAQEAAKTPIKIGELLCYTTCPDVAKSWREGWQMALDEINKSGGVLGRPLEVISRDDKADPAETVKRMEELSARENIKIFFGTLYDHTSLAAISFAKQKQFLFVKGYGGSDDMTGKYGHDLFFQIGPTNNMLIGILAEKAAASGKKRWAFVAADYAFGHSAVEVFQHKLKLLNPAVEFIETQWFPIGKLDAGVVTQAVAHSKPDGIFSVVFLGDYLRFVREGNKRYLFDNRLNISPLAGYSAYIEPLGKEAPVGWLSGYGYPVQQITDVKHRQFIDNYKSKHGSWPDSSVVLGYDTLKLLAAAIKIAGTDDPKKVSEVMHKTTFDMPDGALSFRADGISTYGDWTGATGFLNGIPTVLDPEYVKPEKYMPPIDEVMKSREESK